MRKPYYNESERFLIRSNTSSGDKLLLHLKIQLLKRAFKRLFERKDKPKENLFTIEYYPETDRYYPKYKDRYLHTEYSTGIINIKEDYLFQFCNYDKTESEAIKLINKFKEQQLKENVITIVLK